MKQNYHPYRKWIIFGLFWALIITLCRAVRWPNDWAEAQWLINYDYGLIKRALLGAVFRPLIMAGSGQSAETVIRLISTVFLVGFYAVLLWMIIRILKKSDFNLNVVLAAFAFLSSSYVVMSAHLMGYFDNILVILTFLSCLMVLKGKSWLAAIMLAIGIIIHETIFLVGLPSVLFLALLGKTRELKDAAYSGPPYKPMARALLPFILPLLTFAFLFVYQNSYLESESIRAQLITHLSQFGFIRPVYHTLVPGDLTTPFTGYFNGGVPEFFSRLFDLGYILRIVPTLLVILILTGKTLRRMKYPGILLTSLVAISLLPLALHLIAADTSRIWTYPLIIAMFALWGLYEVIPGDKIVKIDSSLFSVCCLMIIMANIFSMTPLMDELVDRYNFKMRVLYYLPMLVVIAAVFSGYFRPKSNSS